MKSSAPLVLSLLVSGSLALGCAKDAPPPETAKPAASSDVTVQSATTSAPASSVAPAEAKPVAAKPAVTITDCATPESVLYDDVADRYLVSNVNGKPLEKDNNGYISSIHPDTGVVTKWIAGGANKITLNAPKGTAIVKGVLYVSDIDTVRMFDAKTGASKGEVAIKGSTFLNDIAAGPDGKIYVSDSGMKQGEKDFEGTGTDAIWVIDKGVAKVHAKGIDLGRPNGLLWTSKGLLVNTFASNELYRLDEKGQRQDVTKLPNGGLDGLVAIGPDLLVTSWGGKAIYRGTLGGTFVPAFEEMSAPADIGYDTKRHRVLVPRMMDNKVEYYDLN